MTDQQRDAREISNAVIEAGARAHHAAYEARAHNLGYETREESRVEWDDLSDTMKVLMLDAERASLEAALAALDAEGWAVERLEQVGWMWTYPSGEPFVGDMDALLPTHERLPASKVYRVISPSTREAEK